MKRWISFAVAIVALAAMPVVATASDRQEGPGNVSYGPFASGSPDSATCGGDWADDTFSLAIMREFYLQLAAGADKGEALRKAKLTMLRRFGPQAVPKLWSGLLMYGDSVGAVIKSRGATTN